MKIGIDLSPLQNAHRMRGIGYTLINFINNLSSEDRQEHSFVFFVLPEAEALFNNPTELLDLHDINYEVRSLNSQKRLPYILPGRLNMIFGAINRLRSFRSYYFGDSRISSLVDIDVFLQADQNHALPRTRKVKKVLIIYDLIPYVLEWDYWWTYRTARLRGCSRIKALHKHIKRLLLIHKVRANTKKADKLLAISEFTKNDFIRYLAVPSAKIEVILLGVTQPSFSDDMKQPKLKHYIKTSWGFVKRPLELDKSVPFLLYIGGADQRRKLVDLVTAFNSLRARGHNLKLILVGDIMLGPSAITTHEIKDALKKSSYLDDIIFMGFVDDSVKDWLYKNALTFVFPSRHEGFGLPVLEAMVHDCPVIAYKNQAVVEVAHDAPIYANSPTELAEKILELQSISKQELEVFCLKARTQAKKYSWGKTSSSIINNLSKVNPNFSREK